jgi:hypothetical protein
MKTRIHVKLGNLEGVSAALEFYKTLEVFLTLTEQNVGFWAYNSSSKHFCRKGGFEMFP